MGRSIDCKLDTFNDDGEREYDLVYSIPLGALSPFVEIAKKHGIGMFSEERDEDGDWICNVITFNQDDVAKMAKLLGEMRALTSMLDAIHRYCRKNAEREEYVMECD